MFPFFSVIIVIELYEFQNFVANLQRELKGKRNLLLFYGGGYDSQLLLVALSKIRRHITVAHTILFPKSYWKHIRKVQTKYPQHHWIKLRANIDDADTKTWTIYNETLFTEEHKLGFSSKDYTIILGHKLHEPYQIKAFEYGVFKSFVTPLLRYSDEWVACLYQDMKDTEQLGKFLHSHLVSDSPHPSLNIS